MRTSIFIKHININMHDLRTDEYTLKKIIQHMKKKIHKDNKAFRH